MKNYIVVKIPKTPETEHRLNYLKSVFMENSFSGVAKRCISQTYLTLTKYKSEKHVSKVAGSNLLLEKQIELCMQLPNAVVDEENHTCTFLVTNEITKEEYETTRPLNLITQEYVDEINNN